MPVQSSGIDHVHLMVEDIAKAADLYTTLLDCERNIPLYIDSIKALNSMNTLGLDVFEPVEADGIAAQQMARFGGPGLTTVSLHVEDIEAATAHIESCGVPVMSRIGYPGVEIQTQFHPRACFGMVLELVQYEPGHEQVIAEIKAKQAAENEGRISIPAKPGALTGARIDHVHLRVDDLAAARGWFETLFVCAFESVKPQGGSPRALRSDLGIHLVESAGEKQGLGSIAFSVDDFAAAEELTKRLGLTRMGVPDHAAEDACLRFDPRELYGLALEFVTD